MIYTFFRKEMYMKRLLHISDLSHTYEDYKGSRQILKNISFDIYESEFVAIVGPKDCGKSTLLSIIAGLITPTSGRILIHEKNPETANVNIGYLFQKEHLLQCKTPFRNLAVGLEFHHSFNNGSYLLLNRYLETYGLIAFKDFEMIGLDTEENSSKTVLIKNLLLEPDFLLLDDPFSILCNTIPDIQKKNLWKLLKKENKTVLFVTDNINDAAEMADRILIFSQAPAVLQRTIM